MIDVTLDRNLCFLSEDSFKVSCFLTYLFVFVDSILNSNDTIGNPIWKSGWKQIGIGNSFSS